MIQTKSSEDLRCLKAASCFFYIAFHTEPTALQVVLLSIKA